MGLAPTGKRRLFTRRPHCQTMLEIFSVLVTPVSRAEKGAFPHLTNVALWQLDEFRKWAVKALGVIRELRRTLGDAIVIGLARTSTIRV